jgi:hypothetical protein
VPETTTTLPPTTVPETTTTTAPPTTVAPTTATEPVVPTPRGTVLLTGEPTSSTKDGNSNAHKLLLVVGLFITGGLIAEVAFGLNERRYR